MPQAAVLLTRRRFRMLLRRFRKRAGAAWMPNRAERGWEELPGKVAIHSTTPIRHADPADARAVDEENLEGADAGGLRESFGYTNTPSCGSAGSWRGSSGEDSAAPNADHSRDDRRLRSTVVAVSGDERKIRTVRS